VIETALFWLCCGVTVAGALGAAVVRHLVHAALLLGLCLVGVAGLYLFLEAEYLACIQVLVYVGGILVLVIFASLFSADIQGAVQRTPWWLRLAGLGAAGLAALVAGRLAQAALAGTHTTRLAPGADHLASGTLGRLLIGDWLTVFLLAGMLLTVALVAAVAIVRRHQSTTKGDDAS
jgi:NADH-quinone oxidoreductase subunit J